MTGLLLALTGAYGVFLLYTAVAFGWLGVGLGPRPIGLDGGAPSFRRRLAAWAERAGLGDCPPTDLAATSAAVALVAGAAAFVVFGGVAPPIATGALAATLPAGAHRSRRARRRAEAREAWPRMIEEIRVATASLGRPIPQALLDAGRRGPAELRPAFAAAEREWLVTTDFARACTVLKARLADPTADAACETLLVAHELGGGDIDRRLAALAEDRVLDLHGRKDAEAKQAGVRFARRFVLVVPAGMALVGVSIGTGRDAYGTATGQLLVVAGLAVVAACWAWAGRLMRLPEEERVLR